MVILQCKEEQMLDSKELKIQSKTWTRLCWGKTRMWSMITQIIEGQGWYFSTWIRSISLKSSECWWWTWHICREVSWSYNRSAMTSSQRNDEAKGYWTMGMTQTQNQVCYSRRNDMTRKIDERLAHRRNLCSRKKDQVAQLKFSMIMI